MENRTIVLLTLVFISMGILFTLNFLSFNLDVHSDKFISRNEVRGMAVEHDGRLYTLNFQQQNQVIDILNRSVRVGHNAYRDAEQVPFGYQRLIIYRFGDKEISLKPEALVNVQLLFSVPEWSTGGFLQETDPGNFNPLLSKTYDS